MRVDITKRLLKGGRVVDPVNGRDGVFDVLIDGDRLARIGRELAVGPDVAVVPIPSGLVICPGLIHARTGAVLASFAIGCQRYHLRFYAARCRPAAEPRALRPMMKASTRATAP